MAVGLIASNHPGSANSVNDPNPDGSDEEMVAQNLILNGEYDTGTSNWSLTDFTSPAGSSISVVQGANMSGNNALRIDIVNTDNSGWKLQLEQLLNFRLEVGKTYRLKFMAKAESNRNVTVSLFGNGTNYNYYYSYVPFSLNTSTQEFTIDYQCTNPDVDNEPNFSLKFYLADGVVSDVWLDKISIEDITDMVTNVEVDPTFVVLNTAQTWQLAKTISPANAVNQQVAWSSDNTSAVHVSSTGLVTAVGPGSATITATTIDGGLTATAVVNVPETGSTPVLNHEFDSGTSAWFLDDVTGGPGVASISTVSGTGLSGANALKVDIVNDNDTYWKVQLKNTVPFRFELGRSYRISFMAKAESTREINVSLWGNGSNSDYYITTSELTTSSQTLTFDFTFNNANVNTEPSFAIKFYLANGVVSDVWVDNLTVQDITDIVTGVTVSPDFVALNQGQTWQLSKTITPSTATNQNVNWTSSNSNVATVNSTGLVTAAGPGTATITATTADGGLTATSVINVPTFGTTTVQNGELDSGSDGWFLYDFTTYPSTAGMSVVTGAGLSGTNALRIDVVNTDNSTWMLQLFKMLDFRFEVGKTYRISFIGKAESARGIDIAVWGNTGNVNYSYYNLNLTTLPQTLTVDFTFTDPEINNEASFGIKFYMAKGVISDIWLDNLTVQDITPTVNVTDVSVSPSSLNLNIGQEAQITKSIVPTNASNQIVNWTSDNPSIAVVNAAGLIMAVSTGVATITATTVNGGFTASTTVNVASENETTSSAILEQFAFEYKYDGRRRMTHKKVPGADWVYMVYDNRDRLVMTQDGNQRSKQTPEWSFTKYDALNRPVLTGIYNDTARHQESMQSAVNNFYIAADQANNTDDWFEEAEGSVHGYTNNSFPKVSEESNYLTVTYYDDYSFQQLIGSDSSDFNYDSSQLTASGNEPGQYAEKSTRVDGQVTGTKIKNLDTNEFLWSINYYDDRYRVIQMITQNNRGGLDKITNVYDFVGKVLRTKTQHGTDGNNPTNIATTRRLSYDHAGRLIQTEHATDTADPVILSKNKYNELGQLITKNLHSEDEISYKQQVDYRYNIRGWLTRINDSELSSVDGGPKDYFGIELGYNDAIGIFATAQYNGNISAMKWSTNLGLGFNDAQLEIFEPTARGYAFTYDALNRLRTSKHFENTVDWSTATSFHENIDEYDLNGNIKKLKRTGKDGNNMD